MRIPLRPVPQVQASSRDRGSDRNPLEVRAAWAQWIAARCPRESLANPVEDLRLLNNLKPYTPSIKD